MTSTILLRHRQMVQHLKQQIVELKDELSLATGEEREGELDDSERDR